MQGEMSPARVANAICQDSSFCGLYLLVEGKRDFKLYGKFVDGEKVRIKTTQGKYRLREIQALLVERGFLNSLGIRDADFLRISGNNKYSKDYADAIFATDHHDAEVMLAQNGVMDDYLRIVSDPERVNGFEAKFGPVLELVMRLIYPLGCLRLANKRFNLGLSFKPERPEGKQIKIRSFIDDATWKLDVPIMINTVWEYSKNRGQDVESPARIADAFRSVFDSNYPVNEMSNGHDFSAVLHMVSVKGLKSTNKILQDGSCVEDIIIALFDLRKFSFTQLYNSVQGWTYSVNKPLVFKQP